MSRLQTIRGGLSSLRLTRQTIRWSTALSAVAIAILWSLAAIFVLDFGFERLGFHTTGLQRLILVALGAAACVWAYLRFSAPLLKVSETDAEMALWVEKQQGIDSDLIAALQFEEPEAKQWGSPQLETAVVDYVSEWGRGLDVFEGLDRREMAQRGGILAVSVAIAVIAAAIFPGHISAFLQRVFLLAPTHYPSDTVVEQIAVNGRDLGRDVTSLESVPSPYGQPINFEIRTSGVDPKSGTIQLRSDQAGNFADVELKPIDKDASHGLALGTLYGHKLFAGRLPRLLDTVSYQLYLNDAWTNSAEIRLVPLPVVKPTLKITPPAYAAKFLRTEQEDLNSLQRSALEGSSANLSLEASTKPLKSVKLTWVGQKSAPPLELVLASDPKTMPQLWQVKESADAAQASPLAQITEPLRFELQVTDEDGLQLEQPLRGSIGIKGDRKPQVSADIVHKFVVPEATPIVGLRLRDDFGIKELRLQVTIVRAEKRGSASNSVATPASSDQPADPNKPAAVTPVDPNANEERLEHLAVVVASKEAAKPGQPRIPPKADQAVALKLPISGERLPVDAWYPLPLAPFKLVKGDQLKLTFEAVDERGSLPGESSTSEPLILEVTDSSGVLAAIAEEDARSEKGLTDITNLQLGIGDGK